MKVKDLKAYLNQPFVTEDLEVEVLLSEVGVAFQVASNVKGLQTGIDFDAGKLFILPQDDLIRKNMNHYPLREDAISAHHYCCDYHKYNNRHYGTCKGNCGTDAWGNATCSPGAE